MTPPRGQPRPSDDESTLADRRKRKRSSASARAAARAVLAIAAVLGAPRRRRRAPRSPASPRSAPRCDLELAAAGRDRPELVRLRRRRLACSARSRPSGTASPCRSSGSAPWMPQGDGRDRGPALLPARRRRLRGHRARALEGRERRPGRRGRLDDHAAARPQPLHRPRADLRAQAQGGVPRDQARPGVVEGADPRDVPEQVYYGNHAYGVEAAAQTYFSKHAQRADPPPGGAARRPAAGAVDLRPVPEPRRRDRAAQRGAARDARTRATIDARAVRLGGQARRSG